MTSQLAAIPPTPTKPSPDLSPVTVLWITDWWAGPVERMASYQGRDCWFRAIFDEKADEWTAPPMPALRAHRRRTPAPLGQPPPLGGLGRKQLLLPRQCAQPDLKPSYQDLYQHDDLPMATVV